MLRTDSLPDVLSECAARDSSSHGRANTVTSYSLISTLADRINKLELYSCLESSAYVSNYIGATPRPPIWVSPASTSRLCKSGSAMFQSTPPVATKRSQSRRSAKPCGSSTFLTSLGRIPRAKQWIGVSIQISWRIWNRCNAVGQ